MDKKKISLWSLGVVGSFLVMLIAAYFIVPYINPEKQEVLKNSEEIQEDFSLNEIKASSVDSSLVSKADSLKQLVTLYSEREVDYLTTIDSLKNRIEIIEEEKKVLQSKIPDQVEIENIEDVSKSLLNLGEDQLSPIVNILSEDQLLRLYQSASSMQKTKLLRSLEPEKAANILKEIL